MPLIRLAWRYATADKLSLALRVLLVAAACALVTLMVQLSQQVDRMILRDAQGIDAVIGAKGSALQLVLAGVYHVDYLNANIKLSELEVLKKDRMIAEVIPLSLGDSFKGFRIIGAPARYAQRLDARLSSAQDAWATTKMQVVLGSDVARATALARGAKFFGTHGLVEGGTEHTENAYEVVGVMQPTGSALDRLVLTSLESVWFVHEGEPKDDKERLLLEQDREVSLALVRYASPIAAATVPRRINASASLQLASPANEAARLRVVFGRMINVVQALVALLSILALLGVLSSVVQAVVQRRYEFATLRACGASFWSLARLVWLEVLMISFLGVILGAVLGRAALVGISLWLSPKGELALNPWLMHGFELGFFGAILIASVLMATLPLWWLSRQSISDALNS